MKPLIFATALSLVVLTGAAQKPHSVENLIAHNEADLGTSDDRKRYGDAVTTGRR